MRRRERVVVGDSRVRKTDSALSKGDDLVLFKSKNIGYHRHVGNNNGSWQGRIYFSTNN